MVPQLPAALAAAAVRVTDGRLVLAPDAAGSPPRALASVALDLAAPDAQGRGRGVSRARRRRTAGACWRPRCRAASRPPGRTRWAQVRLEGTRLADLLA